MTDSSYVHMTEHCPKCRKKETEMVRISEEGNRSSKIITICENKECFLGVDRSKIGNWEKK